MLVVLAKLFFSSNVAIGKLLTNRPTSRASCVSSRLHDLGFEAHFGGIGGRFCTVSHIALHTQLVVFQ